MSLPIQRSARFCSSMKHLSFFSSSWWGRSIKIQPTIPFSMRIQNQFLKHSRFFSSHARAVSSIDSDSSFRQLNWTRFAAGALALGGGKYLYDDMSPNPPGIVDRREALADLESKINEGGFVVLSGCPSSGKTELVRSFERKKKEELNQTVYVYSGLKEQYLIIYEAQKENTKERLEAVSHKVEELEKSQNPGYWRKAKSTIAFAISVFLLHKAIERLPSDWRLGTGGRPSKEDLKIIFAPIAKEMADPVEHVIFGPLEWGYDKVKSSLSSDSSSNPLKDKPLIKKEKTIVFVSRGDFFSKMCEIFSNSPDLSPGGNALVIFDDIQTKLEAQSFLDDLKKISSSKGNPVQAVFIAEDSNIMPELPRVDLNQFPMTPKEGKELLERGNLPQQWDEEAAEKIIARCHGFAPLFKIVVSSLRNKPQLSMKEYSEECKDILLNGETEVLELFNKMFHSLQFDPRADALLSSFVYLPNQPIAPEVFQKEQDTVEYLCRNGFIQRRPEGFLVPSVIQEIKKAIIHRRKEESKWRLEARKRFPQCFAEEIDIPLKERLLDLEETISKKQDLDEAISYLEGVFSTIDYKNRKETLSEEEKQMFFQVVGYLGKAHFLRENKEEQDLQKAVHYFNLAGKLWQDISQDPQLINLCSNMLFDAATAYSRLEKKEEQFLVHQTGANFMKNLLNWFGQQSSLDLQVVYELLPSFTTGSAAVDEAIRLGKELGKTEEVKELVEFKKFTKYFPPMCEVVRALEAPSVDFSRFLGPLQTLQSFEEIKEIHPFLKYLETVIPQIIPSLPMIEEEPQIIDQAIGRAKSKNQDIREFFDLVESADTEEEFISIGMQYGSEKSLAIFQGLLENVLQVIHEKKEKVS